MTAWNSVGWGESTFMSRGPVILGQDCHVPLRQGVILHPDFRWNHRSSPPSHPPAPSSTVRWHTRSTTLKGDRGNTHDTYCADDGTKGDSKSTQTSRVPYDPSESTPDLGKKKGSQVRTLTSVTHGGQMITCGSLMNTDCMSLIL